MKVLVIDDKPIHHQAAIQTLVGHQVTIVKTYDDAYTLLQEPCAPWQVVDAELERRGFKSGYDPHETEEERAKKNSEKKRIEQELRPSPLFDAVLSDLLMPASGRGLTPESREKYKGQEMPVGFALAFMAVRSGAKYVAVVTDTGHHDHPASAMLDSFNHAHFNIDGARFGCYQNLGTFVEGTVCKNCNGTGKNEICYCVEDNTPNPKCHSPRYGGCAGTGYRCQSCGSSGKLRGKNWGEVLTHLTT